MRRQWGYCTNVHAGADAASMRDHLQQYALAVKRQACPDEPMGVGLWLSAAAARELLAGHQTAPLAEWLAQAGLLPFTLNGFPYGDFHQAVVKHRVYEPTWWDNRRLQYTLDLIEILHRLLPASMEGSISTLPLAWGEPAPEEERLRAAAERLRRAAEHLDRLEQRTGRRITLCLEPEPGCVLQRSGDLVRFFQEHLLRGGREAMLRRYLGACHDICHAAVMWEDQQQALDRYRAAGVQVGKVQISSALCAPLDRMARADRRAAIGRLADFAEDRYLHQTTVRAGAEGELEFYEDLPEALARRAQRPEERGSWRVHFHVPIYLERWGLLETSRGEIGPCLEAAMGRSGVRHYEVETYAWGVLPPELRPPELAAGIARELRWLREAFPSSPLAGP